MKRALVVYEFPIDDFCDEVSLRQFFEQVLHINNFGRPVSGTWRNAGSPIISMVDGSPNGSKLKRMRIIP